MCVCVFVPFLSWTSFRTSAQGALDGGQGQRSDPEVLRPFACGQAGQANGEEGVMEALRSSLREMETELGPDDPNVQEIRKMLREYEGQRR